MCFFSIIQNKKKGEVLTNTQSIYNHSVIDHTSIINGLTMIKRIYASARTL